MAKLGIENLKVVTKFGCELGAAVDKSLADGKFEMSDATYFMPVLFEIKALGFTKDAIAEAADIDSAELIQLADFVHVELKISKEKVKVVLEKSLHLAAAVLEVVEALKAPATVEAPAA